jgi:hypothetical protein
MIVLSRPVEGREQEYDDWYQNFHLAQVMAIKGFKSAQRFRLSGALGARATWPFLAIYEIETDDLAALVQVIYDRAGGAELLVTEALDSADAYAAIYEGHGAVVRASEGW